MKSINCVEDVASAGARSLQKLSNNNNKKNSVREI